MQRLFSSPSTFIERATNRGVEGDMTLLEKAKKVKADRRRENITMEDIELAIAWARGEVSNGQVIGALGEKAGNTIYADMARALREAFTRGILK